MPRFKKLTTKNHKRNAKTKTQRQFAVVLFLVLLFLFFSPLFKLQHLTYHDEVNNIKKTSKVWDTLNALLVGHPSFPGARNGQGEWGYVADPSTDRLVVSSSAAEVGCNNSLSMIEGEGGNQVLRKIKLSRPSRQSSPRILCLVYTHSGALQNLQAVVDTWAKECDGFVAASNLTLPDIGSVDLVHAGPETYGNIWQKIRSLWVYAHQNYLNQFDYFHVCGDDTYVIVQNLRSYLGGPEIEQILNGSKPYVFSRKQVFIDDESDKFSSRMTNALAKYEGPFRERPLLIGMPHDRNGDITIKGDAIYYQTYPGGGCGYTLNRNALRLFVEKCIPDFLPDRLDSREDMLVGGCFANYGIHTVDTRDDKGAWRYLALNAQEHFNVRAQTGTWSPDLLRSKHGIQSLSSLAAVSSNAVSIHVKINARLDARQEKEIKHKSVPNLLHRHHALIHQLCK